MSDDKGKPMAEGATVLFNGKPYRMFRVGNGWDCRKEDPEVVEILVAERKLAPAGDGNFSFISGEIHGPYRRAVMTATKELTKSEKAALAATLRKGSGG